MNRGSCGSCLPSLRSLVTRFGPLSLTSSLLHRAPKGPPTAEVKEVSREGPRGEESRAGVTEDVVRQVPPCISFQSLRSVNEMPMKGRIPDPTSDAMRFLPSEALRLYRSPSPLRIPSLRCSSRRVAIGREAVGSEMRTVRRQRRGRRQPDEERKEVPTERPTVDRVLASSLSRPSSCRRPKASAEGG